MLQNPNKKNSIQLILVVLFGLGLLSYIIYKASNTSFTHDESYTYTHYVHQSFMDIISYKTPYTNNHILNTMLMKYCEVLFGSSELALRLPNILAFIIYSFFSTLLFYKFCPKFTFPFYLLITLNPYLIDFFTLARGYGLSIAFLVMSLYFLCLYFSHKQNRYLWCFNIGAFLAVIANFSLLNYYVAALIVYNLLIYIHTKHTITSYQFYKYNKINSISIVVLGMVLYEPLRRISKMSLLDFGGKVGFLADTVSTVVYGFFYETHVSDFYLAIAKCFVIAIVLVSLLLIIKNLFQKDSLFFKSHGALALINLILLIIVLITIIQHLLLGNDFYIDRFALFFYPIFILNFTFLMSYVYDKAIKKTTLSVVYLVAIAAIFNMYLNYNVVYYKDWKWDKDTKLVMKALLLEHEKTPEKQIRLGINWLLEPSTNFYRYTWGLNWLNPTNRKGISKYDNYWYVFKMDKEYEFISKNPVIFSDELSGSILLKNTN